MYVSDGMCVLFYVVILNARAGECLGVSIMLCSSVC